MSLADDNAVYPVHGYYMVGPSMCHFLSQANIWLRTNQQKCRGAGSNFVSSSHGWNLFTTQSTFVLNGCLQVLQLRTVTLLRYI